MNRFIIGVLLFAATSVFAASGDKPNQMNLSFRNVSSSTKPAGCVIGELKRNDAYIFLCASSHKWRRIDIGGEF